MDVTDRSDIGIEVYTYLSINKLAGTDFSLDPIKDISILAGLNISNKPENEHFKAYLAGLSLDFSNSYFYYLQLDIAVYKGDNIKNKYGVQLTPVWSYPFQIGSAKFKFRGFTDFRTGNTNNSGNFHILAQPQLLLDVGDLEKVKSNTIFVGAEYSYWLNKFGVKDVNESVLQAMVIGFLAQ